MSQNFTTSRQSENEQRPYPDIITTASHEGLRRDSVWFRILGFVVGFAHDIEICTFYFGWRLSTRRLANFEIKEVYVIHSMSWGRNCLNFDNLDHLGHISDLA